MAPGRSNPRRGALDRARRWLGARVTDLEYALRVAPPFTHGRGARRVFYPGCSLTAADPALVLRAYEWLRARDPEVALWSDCCGMPLEKFSTPEAAERGRNRTRAQLVDAGTEEIITACGNCTVQFRALGVPGLRLTSLYGLLADEDWGPRPEAGPTVVHHPCAARIDKEQQAHFRRLASRLHLNVINADEAKHPLACCLVKTPAAMEKREALAGSTLVTYCAHCTMAFQGDLPTRHVLQETFGAPGDRWRPRGKLERFAQYRRLAQLAASRGAPTSRSVVWRRAAIVMVAALGVVLLLSLGRASALSAAALSLAAWSRGAGALGPLVYAAAYVVATVLALPGSLLTLGAGFAWGPARGVALVSPVSVLAATAAFALGRTALRSRVERRLGADPRLAALDRAVRAQGLRLVLLLRLSPILPFNALNYALSLTSVRWQDYVLGSMVGMFPATVLYVYLGSLVTSGAQWLSAGAPQAGAAGAALTWGGLAATFAAVTLLTRRARVELHRALAAPETRPAR